MSRALTIYVILSALATGAAIVLGVAADALAWSDFWPDFMRAVAIVSWVVGALVWSTERVAEMIDSARGEVESACAEIRQEICALQAAAHQEVVTLREIGDQCEKRTAKRLRRLEALARERIEAAHQVQSIFDQRRRSGTDR